MNKDRSHGNQERRRGCGNRIRLCAQNRRRCIVGSHQQARLRKDAPHGHARTVQIASRTRELLLQKVADEKNVANILTKNMEPDMLAKHLAEMVFIKQQDERSHVALAAKHSKPGAWPQVWESRSTLC